MEKITGKTLIALGFEPAKWFKSVITYANQHHLRDESLIAYINTVRPTIIEPHSTPIPFFKNISSASDEEKKNEDAVIKTMTELLKTPTLVAGAVMPDACPTGAIGHIPVGGVAVAKNAIHPAMHSADICCSVMMTNLGIVSPQQVLDAAQKVTHFGGLNAPNRFEADKKLLDKMRNNAFLKDEKCLHLAQKHLGTQGDGNHFLYVGQSKKNGQTMMVTHHGSRGVGAWLYSKGMKVAEYFRKEISPNTLPTNAWIPYDTKEGEAYWEALQIVREWTKQNHSIIHDATCRLVGVAAIERCWNEHNFVFKENDLFYHAKGATPLDGKFVPDATDGRRLIPLNMCEPILIVEGKTTKNNLGFAPHGAGRNLSRTQHIQRKATESKEEVFARETKGIDVRFYSNHIDISELPSAYKNAQSIQEQMETFKLGKVVDKILPYGCIMAGDWQIDAPWRKKRKNNTSKT